MPYTPDATVLTQPADTGVLAATAAAEFRTLKTYIAGAAVLGAIAARVVSGGALGTPSSGNLSNCTAYPLSALTGAAAGVLTFLATPSSANLAAALTDESGSGACLFQSGDLGTPSAGVATNLTGTAASLTAGTATAANGLKSATTTVSVSGATAPSANQVLTATNSTTATWVTPTAAPANTLDVVLAAVGARINANGDNAIAWNWQLTTAAKSAFKFGETAAATNGVASQYLVDIGTLAASTAIPLRVAARASDVLVISPVGAVTVQANTGAAATVGSSISLTAGTAGGTGVNGGTITLKGGTTAVSGASAGGAVSLTGGDSSSTSGAGGIATLAGGGGGSGGPGGDANVTGGIAGSGGAPVAGNVNVTAGGGSLGSSGGNVNITGGIGGSVSVTNGGNVTIAGGAAQAGTGNGGTVAINAGARNGSGAGSAVNLTASNGITAGVGGNIGLTAGNGVGAAGGDLTFTTGTGSANGKVNFVNVNVANAAVASVFTANVGPTGANTAIQGWLAIKVGGTARFIPFW